MWYGRAIMAAPKDRPTPKSKLRLARERCGLTQQQLAELAETSQPQIDRLETGKRKLSIDWLVRLAPHLGVTPIELSEQLGGLPDDRTGRKVVVPAIPLPPSTRGRKPMSPLAGQIPIRNAARGGKGQEMFLSDGPIGFTNRPNSLAGVRDAYALYMTGESMEPRYYQGWLLHVNPFKPLVRGRDVVIYKTDNAVMVKEFVRRDASHVVVRQLNPKQELRIPAKDVRETHLIVGSDQEG
jgi:phage repressor protein C with HTH and peptisase S24 domain